MKSISLLCSRVSQSTLTQISSHSSLAYFLAKTRNVRTSTKCLQITVKLAEDESKFLSSSVRQDVKTITVDSANLKTRPEFSEMERNCEYSLSFGSFCIPWFLDRTGHFQAKTLRVLRAQDTSREIASFQPNICKFLDEKRPTVVALFGTRPTTTKQTFMLFPRSLDYGNSTF